MNISCKKKITKQEVSKNFKCLKKEIGILTNNSDNFYLNNKVYHYSLLDYLLKFRNIKEISILDLCISLNCFIPHYCYHPSLSIAGNCRMCLIELNKSQKPIVSCAVKIMKSNTIIKTNTFIVKRAREGIMEFLLVNHPLDCPICDQGGECDLQDQSVAYGSDRGRFYHVTDLKRAVTDFMCHPMIKVILTRCIHCTRCIRFLNEIEGNYSLGMLGRGNSSEIGLYTDSLLITELGSNITDICPVGALTIKPYALNYRAWDEIYYESIDLTDSLCSPIRVYSNFKKIKRILPDFNNELKVNWIHEKTRYFFDALTLQKLEFPLIRRTNLRVASSLKKRYKNVFKKISWTNLTKNILIFLKNFKKFFNFKIFLGDFLDLLSLYQLKILCNLSNSRIYSFSERVLDNTSNLLNIDLDSNYIFQVSNFEKYNSIFLINVNLRFESPILNAKLRQSILWLKRISINYIGTKYNLTYKYRHLGISTKSLLKIVEGKYRNVNLKKTNSLFLYNHELFNCYKNTEYRSLFNFLKRLNKDLDIFYLAKNVATIASFDLSLEKNILKKTKKHSNRIYYYLGSNKFLWNINNIMGRLVHNLSIYQNNIGDKYYNFIDIILPSYSFVEAEVEYYLNCYGILKMSRQIIFPLNIWIKDNLDIIKIISRLSLIHIFNKEPKMSRHFYKNIKLVLCKEKKKTISWEEEIKTFFCIIFKAYFRYNYAKKLRGQIDLLKILPLHLYKKRRLSFFKILETKIYSSNIYFYLLTLKNRNFFKTNSFINYSQNLNLISEVYFIKKTNFKL